MKNKNFEERLKAHSENMINSIDAPFNISEKIDKMEIDGMKKKVVSLNWLKKTAYSAATAAAAFVLVFNLIPGLSYAASDIPVLGDVVRIVTFGRFEVSKENYEANIVTPKIEGLADKALEDRLNEELSENAGILIAAFENDVEMMAKEYGEDKFYLGVTADYEVKTDNENIFAVDFHITRTEASGATTHRFYNIDKKAGTLITLESLFLENSDYTAVISEYIADEMKIRNESGEDFYFVGEDEPEKFEKIRKDQGFYINDEGNIVICFDEYEIAAGAEGSPEFEIPSYIIEDIRK